MLKEERYRVATIGLIRGNFLNLWEWQLFGMAKKHNIIPICTIDNKFSTAGIPHIRRTDNVRRFNKVPLLSTLLQGVLPVNDYMFGLKEKVKDCSILHTADPHYPFSYQAAALAKPCVFTVWENLSGNNERSLYRLFKRQSYKRGALFLPVTKKSRDALIAEGVPENKIRVFSPGIDTMRFAPSPKDKALCQKYEISSKSKCILFTARVCREKGIEYLLAALRGLMQKDKDIVLLIAGSGPLRSRVEDAKREGLNIVYLDFCPYEDMPKIYGLADIVCIPSIRTRQWEEQWGYAFVEAMACGKPVISTKTGSIEEVVEDGKTGILVEQKSAQELQKAITLLLTDKKAYRDMAYHARKRAMACFDAEKQMKKLESIYDSVLRGNNA